MDPTNKRKKISPVNLRRRTQQLSGGPTPTSPTSSTASPNPKKSRNATTPIDPHSGEAAVSMSSPVDRSSLLLTDALAWSSRRDAASTSSPEDCSHLLTNVSAWSSRRDGTSTSSPEDCSHLLLINASAWSSTERGAEDDGDTTVHHSEFTDMSPSAGAVGSQTPFVGVGEHPAGEHNDAQCCQRDGVPINSHVNPGSQCPQEESFIDIDDEQPEQRVKDKQDGSQEGKGQVCRQAGDYLVEEAGKEEQPTNKEKGVSQEDVKERQPKEVGNGERNACNDDDGSQQKNVDHSTCQGDRSESSIDTEDEQERSVDGDEEEHKESCTSRNYPSQNSIDAWEESPASQQHPPARVSMARPIVDLSHLSESDDSFKHLETQMQSHGQNMRARSRRLGSAVLNMDSDSDDSSMETKMPPRGQNMRAESRRLGSRVPNVDSDSDESFNRLWTEMQSHGQNIRGHARRVRRALDFGSDSDFSHVDGHVRQLFSEDEEIATVNPENESSIADGEQVDEALNNSLDSAELAGQLNANRHQILDMSIDSDDTAEIVRNLQAPTPGREEPGIPTESSRQQQQPREGTGNNNPAGRRYPERCGVGVNFPTWQAPNPTSCTVASDMDWLLLQAEHPDYLFPRFQPADFHVIIFCSLFRTNNNKASRVAASSATDHFKPSSPWSAGLARRPLCLAFYPNIVIATFSVKGYVFHLSVYLLMDDVRLSNFMTDEELAVLCAALNAARKFHKSLIQLSPACRHRLENAVNAMPSFHLGGEQGEGRKQSEMKAEDAFSFFQSMRYALEKLACNPHAFKSDDHVVLLKGWEMDQELVKAIATTFLKKSVWQASCAGCKNIAPITEIYKLDLTDCNKTREYLSRTVASLQQEAEGIVNFTLASPPAVFAIDLAMVIQPLVAGVSFVLDGIAASRFAQTLFQDTSRRGNNRRRAGPPPISSFFEESSQWNAHADFFPLPNWVQFPSYGRLLDDPANNDAFPGDERAGNVTVDDFPNVLEIMDEFFFQNLIFDGRCGEPKYARRWREYLKSGGNDPYPQFSPEQLLCYEDDQLHPTPSWGLWNAIRDRSIDLVSEQEDRILDAYQGYFPFGLRGIRLLSNYYNFDSPKKPVYRGRSRTNESYRRQLWSGPDWHGNIYMETDEGGDYPGSSSNREDDGAGSSEGDASREPEIDDVEAAVMERLEEQRRNQQNGKCQLPSSLSLGAHV